MLELDQQELEEQAFKHKIRIPIVEAPLKFTYYKDPRTKHIYEPFRSKDIQEIIYKVVEINIDLPDLKRKKIVLDQYFMHEFYSIADIEQKYMNTSWKDTFKQSFRDDKPQTYYALTALKNYLGERWGFHFAFL